MKKILRASEPSGSGRDRISADTAPERLRALEDALKAIKALSEQCDPYGGGGPFNCHPISEIVDAALGQP